MQKFEFKKRLNKHSFWLFGSISVLQSEELKLSKVHLHSDNLTAALILFDLQ